MLFYCGACMTRGVTTNLVVCPSCGSRLSGPVAGISPPADASHQFEALTMAKTGRPSAYDAVMHPEMARKVCLLGATDREVAGILGIGETTLKEWRARHPEFAEALRVGKEAADERVKSSLYNRAVGYSFDSEKIRVLRDGTVVRVPIVEHVPPDVTAQIFWLKNRDRENWRDRQDHEVTGKDGKPIEVEASNRQLAMAVLKLFGQAAAEPAAEAEKA